MEIVNIRLVIKIIAEKDMKVRYFLNSEQFQTLFFNLQPPTYQHTFG